jgi:hypothetical protein
MLSLFFFAATLSADASAAERIWGLPGVCADVAEVEEHGMWMSFGTPLPTEPCIWLTGITAPDSHTLLALDGDEIWAIDTDTGANTLLGTTPRTYADLAADPVTGAVYGRAGSTIYALALDTLTDVEIGTFAPDSVDAVDVGLDGQLVAVGTWLVSMDPLTGATQRLARYEEDGYLPGDLAMRASGMALVATGGTGLYEVDPSTGDWRWPGPEFVQGIAVQHTVVPTLEVPPLAGGASVEIEVTGLSPSTWTRVVAGEAGGTSPRPGSCRGSFPMTHVTVIAEGLSNGAGAATFDVDVPAHLAGRTFHLVAAQEEEVACRRSAAVARVVE